MTDTYDYYKETLQTLRERGDLRRLPDVEHTGRRITASGRTMLNLSSNDYLGLATDTVLQQEFLDGVGGEDRLLSSSSSRLLTGNFMACTGLEHLLAGLFRREAALVFSSGYHMNTGILPALTDAHTLILADKLVHASIIDGIRLSAARCIRFRHQDYAQLERLLVQYHGQYPRIFIVTESIFSMDGDIAPLARLVELKRRYPGVMLYVDEAHAIGVRGRTGLGIAEEQDCIGGVDLLCGTFGKALASVGVVQKRMRLSITIYRRGAQTVAKALMTRVLPTAPGPSTPVTPMTRPLMVQRTKVSRKTSVTPVRPCSTGCFTDAAEWITGAEPSPASLE